MLLVAACLLGSCSDGARAVTTSGEVAAEPGEPSTASPPIHVAGRSGESTAATSPTHVADGPGKPRAATPPIYVAGGFEERAIESGIDFKMSFLPSEQGALFKINLYDHGSGVIVGDIDGDGHDDIYFLNQLGANGLYRNRGDGTFADVTSTSGPIALSHRICTAALFNDIDGDGDQDLFVTSTRGGNALFTNNGKGVFTDVTEQAGVKYVGHSQGATMFDADNDGDLDLLVSNTARWTTNQLHPRDRHYIGLPDLWTLISARIEHNLFYRNDGKGNFEDFTEQSGLAGVGWGGDFAVFDYDEDGDPDVFLSNMFGRSMLFQNDGRGRFRDVTKEALGKTPWGTVGAKAFDYDGDGHLDLLLVDMHSDMWTPFEYDAAKIEPRKKYSRPYGRLAEEPGFDRRKSESMMRALRIPLREVFFGNALYRNNGDGTFEEVSEQAGAETFWSWGIASGDFDNDTYTDVFLASGMGYPYFYWRSALLMNDGDGTFTDRAGQTGIDPPPGGIELGRLAGKSAVRSARSASVLDADGDGRLDLIVNNFNDRAHLMKNTWPARHYVAFRLEGTKSNRDAVGAVVRLKIGSRTLVKQVHAAGGYLAQSTKTVHFGLGSIDEIDECTIQWPSGQTQTIDDPGIDRVHAIREPKS